MEKKVTIVTLGILILAGTFYYFPRPNSYQTFDPDIIQIDTCEDTSSWKQSWGKKICIDETHYTQGSKGIRITTNETGTGYYHEFSEPLDLSNHHIECDIFIENVSQLDRIVFSCYEQDTDNHLYVNTRTLYHPLDTGWNKLHLSRANFRYIGESDVNSWSRIKRIRFSIYSRKNCTTSATFDNIHAVRDAITGGVVSLRFDDSYASIYTEAFPRMEKYGFPGIAATITGLIQENRTSLVCLSDLHEMHEAGWDIISHCHSNGGRLDNKNELERRYELAESKLWLLENGFEPGCDYIALPNHAWDNEVIELVKFYFEGCMTHTGGHEVIPPSDPYKIIVMPIQWDTDVKDVKCWIDECVKNDAWLVLLFHNLEDYPDKYTEYDPDDFQEILDYLYEKDVHVDTISSIFSN
jgi:hypothetical protein